MRFICCVGSKVLTLFTTKFQGIAMKNVDQNKEFIATNSKGLVEFFATFLVSNIGTIFLSFPATFEPTQYNQKMNFFLQKRVEKIKERSLFFFNSLGVQNFFI